MLEVMVVDENGAVQSEVVAFPAELLHAEDDASSICLRFVDPYGDAVFNRLQMHVMQDELTRCERAAHGLHAEVFAAIRSMCHRVQAKQHLYLKFVGD